MNRLTEVSSNGTVVSTYEYSPDGLRQVKRGSKGTIHYVFEGTEPIFEKRIKDEKIKSYIYALGKHLARVDGIIGDKGAKVYYYHTDQVGTVRAITDQNGTTVFNADYFAFGTKFVSNGDFDETHGFTGKEYDSDTELYYYNARWYDPDLGRFISEDPAADPNNPNLYSYCGNNGITRTDPTGMIFGWDDLLYAVIIAAAAGAIDAYMNGGNPLIGAFVGAVAGAVGYCCGELCGAYLASSLTAVGAAAVGGALSGGIMSSLMDESFWAGARTGAISAGVSYWLSSVEVGSSASKAPTGNVELERIRQWFNGSMGELAATGEYKFSAGDALLLSGIDDAIKEALSNSTDKPSVDTDDLTWVDEYGHTNATPNATLASNKNSSNEQGRQSGEKVTSKEVPPKKSGYEPPKGGPRTGKTKDGKKGWLDKDGNVWVPDTLHKDHWDVQYPNGGYDNVYRNGAVRPGHGPRGEFSPPGLRKIEIDGDEILKDSAIISGIIYGCKVAADIATKIFMQLAPAL